MVQLFFTEINWVDLNVHIQNEVHLERLTLTVQTWHWKQEKKRLMQLINVMDSWSQIFQVCFLVVNLIRQDYYAVQDL